MQIHFESDFSIVDPSLIGSQLTFAAVDAGSFSPYKETGFNIHTFSSSLYAAFQRPEKQQQTLIKIKSIGHESIGGNLWGCEFEHIDTNRDFRFTAYLNPLRNTVTGIFAYGEDETEDITDTELIDFWYKRSGFIPEYVSVRKKTLLLLAIQFNHSNWMYFTPYGLNYFDAHIDVSLMPMVFAEEQLFELERLQLLASATMPV